MASELVVLGLSGTVPRPLGISEGETKKISRADAIVKRIMDQALKGDFKAISFIAQYDTKIAARLESQNEQTISEQNASRVDSNESEILAHFAEQARAGNWSPDNELPKSDTSDEQMGEE